MDEVSSHQQAFENLLSQEYGVNVPFSNEICGQFETSEETGNCNLHDENADKLGDSPLRRQTLSPEPSNAAAALSNSKHAKEESARTVNTTQPSSSPISEQRQVLLAPLHGVRGFRSPQLPDKLNINTNPASPFSLPPHTIGPRPHFLTRPTSFLRHEYNPWSQNGPSSPLVDNGNSFINSHSPLFINLPSPSDRQLQHNGRPDPMNQQARQPFEESNLRSSLSQSPNYDMAQPSRSHHYTHYPEPPSYYSPDAHFRQPHTTFNTPVQPRTPPGITHHGHSQDTPTMSTHGLNGINRIASSPHSPRPQVRRESSIGKRRHASMQTDSSYENVQLAPLRMLPQEDLSFVTGLVAAMRDSNQAEDNAGMLKTWEKIRTVKADKLQEKAIEMLRLVRRAVDEDVSEKKAVHQYDSFEHRYEELCTALRTQKTICKHLMEEDYSCIVANDPTYAAQRVKNNRRVNDQKKVAIEVGREVMGEKGHGKGRKVEKVTYIEENEESADDAMSEEDSDYASPVIKSETRSRKKAKKTRRASVDDDSDFTMKTPSSSRKSKRVGRASNKTTGNCHTPSSSRALRTTRNTCQTENGDDASPAMNGSPISHRSHHFQDQYDGEHGYDHYQYHGYGPSMAHGLPSMVPELPRDIFGPSNGYVHHHDQHTPYSSGTDQNYSDDIHGNGEIDTDGYGNSYGNDPFGPIRH